MPNVNIYLDVELDKLIVNESNKKGISKTDVINEALNKFFKGR